MTEPFGFVAGTVGLVVPFFQAPKKLRDQLKLVGPAPPPPGASTGGLTQELYPRLAGSPERKKVHELIEEYEEK